MPDEFTHEQSEVPRNLAQEVHARFAVLGGFDLPEVPREPIRTPPDFK
jgi:hypothetical protein